MDLINSRKMEHVKMVQANIGT